MRAVRNLVAFLLLIALPAAPAFAQSPERYSSNEILDTGHRFFGGVSRGLASGGPYLINVKIDANFK